MNYSEMTREERHDLCKHMLEEVESDLAGRGRTNDFIESLSDWFQSRGKLSENQFEALKKFYDNLS